MFITEQEASSLRQQLYPKKDVLSVPVTILSHTNICNCRMTISMFMSAIESHIFL